MSCLKHSTPRSTREKKHKHQMHIKMKPSTELLLNVQCKCAETPEAEEKMATTTPTTTARIKFKFTIPKLENSFNVLPIHLLECTELESFSTNSLSTLLIDGCLVSRHRQFGGGVWYYFFGDSSTRNQGKWNK